MIEAEEEKNDEKLFEGVGEYWVGKGLLRSETFPKTPEKF